MDQRTESGSEITTLSADVAQWRNWFPETNVPLELILANNNDLTANSARIRLAAANAAIAGAARHLQVSSTLQGSRSRRNNTTGAGIESFTTNSYDLALNLSWEADLWNRLSLSEQAAAEEYRASEADAYAAELSVIANSYRSWFNLAEALAQQELREKNRDIFSDNSNILERNFAEGTATALDVRLIRSSLATADSQYAEAQSLVASRQRELQLLASDLSLAEYQAPLPATLSRLPYNITTDAIEQRPDLIAARLRLSATNLRYAAAKKNLLPSLRLTGSVGENSDEFSDLFDLKNLIWNIAAGLTTPIFEGGRLRAEQAQAAAQQDIAVAEYAQAVLVALNEVRAGLANEQFLMAREQAIQRGLEESSQAEALAFQQYSNGLTDILTVFDAQRRVLDARSGLLQLRNARLQNRVSLLLALGGTYFENANSNSENITQ